MRAGAQLPIQFEDLVARSHIADNFLMPKAYKEVLHPCTYKPAGKSANCMWPWKIAIFCISWCPWPGNYYKHPVCTLSQ